MPYIRAFLYGGRENKILMNSGILSVVGNTPMVSIKNLKFKRNINLYAKLENMNPSGSAKDRSAMSIMKEAMEKGEISEKTTIVESSSGNFGIALAQICRNCGLEFICVCDEKTTSLNKAILKAYGAKLEVVKKKDIVNGEYLEMRKKRVKELLNIIPNSFCPNQYSNIYNPMGHQEAMLEIMREINKIDYIFVAVSTFGTIRGYYDIIKKHELATKIIAVDAVGSVLFDTLPQKRLIPGHGAACVPALFDKNIVDDYVLVNDLECIEGCKLLLEKEGIFAGGSTGGIISAIKKYIDNIPMNSNCVFIVHDRGDRYIDTIYSEQWINRNFN